MNKDSIMSKTDEMKSKIQEMTSKIEEMKKELMEEGQKVFHEAMKDFFVKHPKMHMFKWVQYTPYFNDGEPCVFGVHEVFAVTKAGYEAWADESGNYYELEEYEPVQIDYDAYKANGYKKTVYELTEYADGMTFEEAEAAKKDILAIMTLPDEVFETMFGDHVEVTVTKDGVETEEYSHD